MKRWIFIIVIAALIAAALVWYFWCKSVGTSLAREQHQDDNDACIQNEVEEYSEVLVSRLQLRSSFKNDLDKEMTQEKHRKSETADKKRFIERIIANDQIRQELACHGSYLPFKIDKNDIQPYPGDFPACPSSASTQPPAQTPSPSQTPPPLPTPVPQSVQNNKAPILELAKSVGRLGIRRAGSQSYPAFWGTGFLLASPEYSAPSDVIVTTCHGMDPIMVSKHGKHHLQLDGEELLIDFKWSQKSIDRIEYYDYQCPIKDVLACSSRPGVDVALLYFDKGQCSGTGVLPSGANLDKNKPHTTVKTHGKDKQDACAMSLGKNCVAMIAYADIDHPIDAPTNNVYGVYQDNSYSDFQFVMNDDVARIDKCDKESKVEIMMDIATTTVGESGGVLTYLTTSDGTPVTTPLIVSGMHTCCSAFFNYQVDEIPPASDTACAHLRRTLDNQAISTWSMLHDPDICTALKDHHALPV